MEIHDTSTALPGRFETRILRLSMSDDLKRISTRDQWQLRQPPTQKRDTEEQDRQRGTHRAYLYAGKMMDNRNTDNL